MLRLALKAGLGAGSVFWGVASRNAALSGLTSRNTVLSGLTLSNVGMIRGFSGATPALDNYTNLENYPSDKVKRKAAQLVEYMGEWSCKVDPEYLQNLSDDNLKLLKAIIAEAAGCSPNIPREEINRLYKEVLEEEDKLRDGSSRMSTDEDFIPHELQEVKKEFVVELYDHGIH